MEYVLIAIGILVVLLIAAVGFLTSRGRRTTRLDDDAAGGTTLTRPRPPDQQAEHPVGQQAAIDDRIDQRRNSTCRTGIHVCLIYVMDKGWTRNLSPARWTSPGAGAGRAGCGAVAARSSRSPSRWNPASSSASR